MGTWLGARSERDRRAWHSGRTSLHAFSFLLTCSLVASCGNSDPDIRAVDDPAMQASTQTPAPTTNAAATSPPPAAAPDVAAAPASDAVSAEPATLAYDEAGERIFVPAIGWLDAAALWDDYRNDPAKLPAGLDVAALHALGPPPAAARSNASDEHR